MTFFDRFTIKFKFKLMYMGFFSYVLFTFITIFVIIYAFIVVRGKQEAFNSVNISLLRIQNMQYELFVNQSYSNNNPYSDMVTEKLLSAVDSVNVTYKDLSQFTFWAPSNFSNELYIIENDFTNYNTKLKYITDQHKNIGDVSDGIISQLEVSKLDVRKSLNEFTIEGLTRQFSDLELLEKEFIKDFQVSDFENFNSKSNEIIARLRTLTTSNLLVKYQLTKIIDQITQYKQVFNLFFSKQVEIGLSPYDGLKGEVTEQLSLILSANNTFIASYNTYSKQIANYIILFSFIGQVLAITFGFYFFKMLFRSIRVPIETIEYFMTELLEGKLPKSVPISARDELNNVARKLLKYIASLQTKRDFAEEIGRGNLHADLNKLSESDTLAIALLEMKDSLNSAHVEDLKRKEADDVQDWITSGLASFGDILRQFNNNLDLLSAEIVRNLIKYTNSNYGAVFIVKAEPDSSEPYLELTAAYAADKKKFMKQKVLFYEGLVGTCAVEKRMFVMDNVPEDYIRIESTFGSAPTTSLLIIPLLLNKEIFGVIELSSFIKYEPHHISFVEKLAEDIAITISYVKINMANELLLKTSNQKLSEYQYNEQSYINQINTLKNEIAELQKSGKKIMNFGENL